MRDIGSKQTGAFRRVCAGGAGGGACMSTARCVRTHIRAMENELAMAYAH